MTEPTAEPSALARSSLERTIRPGLIYKNENNFAWYYK